MATDLYNLDRLTIQSATIDAMQAQAFRDLVMKGGVHSAQFAGGRTPEQAVPHR